MSSPDITPDKETVLLHGLPAHIEESLIERAAASGRAPADEVADIIERHIEESGDESI
jgi:hypothetical protein